MVFLIPLFAAKTIATTITVGQAIAGVTMACGVAAGIKGAVDYQKAKKIMIEAEKEYQDMAKRMNNRTARLKKNSTFLAA
jgi:hypothetical protein